MFNQQAPYLSWIKLKETTRVAWHNAIEVIWNFLDTFLV